MIQTKHNPESIEEGLHAAEEFLKDSILVAFDGCHKIYLAMDETDAEFYKANYDFIVEGSYEEKYDAIVQWYEDSCPLRFITAVYTNEEDPNAGFIQLVGQGAE